MGVTPSQELNENGEFVRRPNSMRRSSSNNRLSKTKFDQITASMQIINNLKSEIDIFAGDREAPRYKQFQEILTAVAKEIQVVKTNSKKQAVRDHCDEILGDIQNCLQRLETRVNFNLQNENSLDLGTVESHSFINHGFGQKSPPPTEVPNLRSPHDSLTSTKVSNSQLDYATALENLQRATFNVEQEIRVAIETENSSSLTEFENRIKVLYAELEMIRVEERSPLHEKKIRIGKKLIKSNNQIKMFKKRLDKHPSLADSKTTSKSSRSLNENKIEMDEITKIEHILEKHEIEVLTFDGLKDDKKYKIIEQYLESYWTKVYAIDAIGIEERQRKSLLIERIKNILQELRNRAEGNRTQNIATQQIQNIMDEVQNIKGQLEVFRNSGGDKNVLKFDQDLRSCWAKLNDVKETNENVKQSKQKLIAEIQQILISLSKNSKSDQVPKNENSNTEKEINNDIIRTQILKQVEEFQNHWNHLNYNLNKSVVQKTDACDKILDILQKITKEILDKRNELLLVQKNQSEAKIKAMEVKVNSYTTPDLLEQQTKFAVSASANNEKEIKVQPTVKTIGEIQRIGAEAKSILQQIRQSDCKKNDKEYNNFEINLKKCRLALESIECNKKSDTITNSKQRAVKTIAEGFRVLNEKKVQKTIDDQVSLVRTSKAQEIMDIDAEIQYFRQQIKTFKEVTKNHQYDKIKNGLNECLNKLQLMDDMHIPKQESIRQIQQYHQELETKLAENQAKVKISAQSDLLRRQSSQNLKQIIEQVQKLKSQVDKFSGVYKGLHYKQLEDNILKYLNQLNNIHVQSDEKLENAVLQTKQKIQKYLNILEDKSIKTFTPEHSIPEMNNQGSSGYIVKQVVHQQKVHSVSLEDEHPNASTTVAVSSKIDASQHPQEARKSQLLNPNSPHHKINSLRDELVDIKESTEKFSGKYKDENYSAIEQKLFSVYQDLQKIKDDGHKSVIISKEQYGDYIEKLLEYFENKTKIAEDLQNAIDSSSEIVVESSTSFINDVNESSQTFTINDPLEELGVLEEKTINLKMKIQSCSGAGEDYNYKMLDQQITQLMTQLNKLETGNVAHVREKKKMIGQELHICGLMLEKQAMNFQEYSKDDENMHMIEEILSELEDINKEVIVFNGVKNDNEYCYLDEVLIKLTIKLDDININNNPNLKLARKKAIQQIQENMNILTQRALSKSNF